MSATFLSLMEAITPGGAFALYGVVCVLGYLFCYFVRDLPIHLVPSAMPSAYFAFVVPTRDCIFDHGANVRAVYRVSLPPPPLGIRHELMLASLIQRFWNRQMGNSSRLSSSGCKGGGGLVVECTVDLALDGLKYRCPFEE